jgi:putative nucleotidyltransferase with HDIG domain
MEQNESFQTFYNEMIKLLVSIIEGKGLFIRGHSERVADLSSSFANKLSLPQKTAEKIHLAGMLRDIGMVYIPYELINKPGKLNENEFTLVKQHPLIAEQLLSRISKFRDIIPIIRHHHEHINGTGYPDGLKGADIPLEAKILCLVDTYDAMLAPRPYRPALNIDEALAEINSKKEIIYDVNLVNAFIPFITSLSDSSVNQVENTPIKNIIQQVVNNFHGGNIDLPILPHVIRELQRAIDNPNSTQATISQILEKDAAITIRLISVANSPIYRASSKVLSVKHAVTRLGFKETHSIVFAIANKNLYRTNNKQLMTLMERMWQHALACAYCSKSIANALKAVDIEQYFLMGLLHDIGKVLLLKVITEIPPEELNDPLGLEIDKILISEMIQKAHTIIGSALLDRWGFSQEFARIARMHENTTFDEDVENGILITNLANMLTRKIGYSLFSDKNIDIDNLESRKRLGIDSSKVLSIGEEISSIMKSSAGIY